MSAETRPPKGYRWGEVTIQRWELVDGARVVAPAAVLALIHECGYLGLHKPVVEGFGLWAISHLPSGQKIATLPTQAQARQCIGLLAGVAGLHESSPTLASKSAAMACLSSLQSQWASTTPASRRRPSGQTKKENPSSFSPVFSGYVPTPANRAAQNRAALALGELWSGTRQDGLTVLRQCEDAAALAWREEIIVRVTQPPRALLLETDIPQNPDTGASLARSGGDVTPFSNGRSTPTLRDGTPATPGEFRRRYRALLDLGDRLRAGSRRFQILYREGEAEGWTADRLDRWERIDEKFRALVCEGWLVWSGAAFCFDCAPEEFQRNVVAKLGFIGSREKGWTELGIKSFLRWPEIAAVQPLRREMREKIGSRL